MGKRNENLLVVSNCYLIAAKEPLGANQSSSYLAWFINLYNIIKDYLQEKDSSLLYKIKLDDCVVSCALEKINNHGCPANILNASVWPNAFISGCHYNCAIENKWKISSIDPSLKRLKNLRNKYEYDDCTFRKAYREARKKLLDFED
jgi:hypothetical protein